MSKWIQNLKQPIANAKPSKLLTKQKCFDIWGCPGEPMIPWYLIVSGCLTIMLVLGRFISEKVRILYVNWIPEIVSNTYAYDVTKTQKRTWRGDASWQLVFRAFQFSCLALWVCVEINWCQYFSFFLLYVEDVVHQEHKIPLTLIGGVLAQNTFQLDCSPACNPDQSYQVRLQATMSTTAFFQLHKHNNKDSINCQLEIAIYQHPLVRSF